MATTGKDRQQGDRATAIGAARERVNGFGHLEGGLRQASPWYLWGPYVSERRRPTDDLAVLALRGPPNPRDADYLAAVLRRCDAR